MFDNLLPHDKKPKGNRNKILLKDAENMEETRKQRRSVKEKLKQKEKCLYFWVYQLSLFIYI